MFSRIFKRNNAIETDQQELPESSLITIHSSAFELTGEVSANAAEIDFKFISLIMGVDSPQYAELTGPEKKELARIRSLSQKKNLSDKLIPRLPAVMPKILRAIRNDSTTTQDLADLISGDISLVGEVIRISNSPFYQVPEKITSLKQAIVQLGTQGIRQLVTGATLKPILSAPSGQPGAFSIGYLWDKNQKAAMAAGYLAKSLDEDQFYAYLAGLLSQAGILVIMKQLDPIFWSANTEYTHSFINGLNQLSKMATVELCSFWQMPQEVIEALHQQLHPADDAMSMQGIINNVSNVLAKMSILISTDRLSPPETDITCQIKDSISPLCNECFDLIDLEAI